jgi:ketosteroid isomerase-like protein
VTHPNIELVQGIYAAFGAGDREAVAAGLHPDIRWHNSGHDPLSGTLVGVDAVLDFVMGENHMDEFRMQVTDMLASDERVAVVASTSGRLGSRSIVNQFVHIIRIVDGRVAEVHNYTWDQQAVAEFLAASAA